MTEWRWIPGFENQYMASDDGQIKSFIRYPKGRVMKQSISHWGRVVVNLTLDPGKYKVFYVHRLVGLAFIPNPEGYEQVLHWDDNPLNNYVSNLRWGDDSLNRHDSVRNETHHWSTATHCIHGHEFTPENTYYRQLARGLVNRNCRQCRVDRNRAYKQRKQEQRRNAA